MFRWVTATAFVGGLLSVSSTVHAQQLAFGGDPGLTSYSSFVDHPSSARLDNIIFDNFVVPAGTIWDIVGVFGNVKFSFLSQAPTTLYWQIRSGLDVPNTVGTVLHSGKGTFTGSLPTISLDVPSLSLASGEYWLGLYFNLANPIVADENPEALASINFTNSTNAQNWPDDDRALWLIGANSVTTVQYDLSIGVLGTARTVVPEPSTLLLTAAGTALMIAGRRRKKTPR
jgi:hypothetical protein